KSTNSSSAQKPKTKTRKSRLGFFGDKGVCEDGESEFELASIREGHHAEKHC
ncbi:MAG: hypothetical protein ACI85K_000139, partial [Hyphomicrobiaceae bacterium]